MFNKQILCKYAKLMKHNNNLTLRELIFMSDFFLEIFLSRNLNILKFI